MSASDSQADQPQDEASSAKFDWRLVATLIALVAAGLVSVLLILGFADNERSRELRSWQEKLSLIAESRAQAVETWLATQRGEISELAGNTTVQLFLTDLKFAEGELSDVPDAEGQLEYVNNLFLVAGGRSGFYSEAGEPAVAANLDQPALAGLALLDGQSRVLLTTPAFDPPPLPSSVVEGGGGATLAPLRLDRAGRPVLTAAARVAPLQSENVAGEEVGYVVGRKPVLEPLRALLRQPGPSEASLKIQLLQQDGAGLRYVLPRSDEEGPLSYTVALDTPESAAAYAYLEPRGFATRLDSQGEEVLVTGRRLEGAPWMVMVTVDRGLALGPSEERIRMLIILLFLLLAFVAAVTDRIRLIPNVVVLPYRNPFLVAKSVATIAALSDDRFTLAVGTGYLKGEYKALGVDIEQRNAIFDEALEQPPSSRRASRTRRCARSFAPSCRAKTRAPAPGPSVSRPN